MKLRILFICLFLIDCQKTSSPPSVSGVGPYYDDKSCDALDPTDPAINPSTGLALTAIDDNPFITKAESSIEDLTHTNAHIDPKSYRKTMGWEHVNFSFTATVKDKNGKMTNVPLCQFYARYQSSGERTLINGVLPLNLPMKKLPAWEEWNSQNTKVHLQTLIAKIWSNDSDHSSLKIKESTVNISSFVASDTDTSVEDNTDSNVQSQIVAGTLKVGSRTLTEIEETPCLIYDKDVNKDAMLPGWELNFKVNKRPYYGMMSGDKIYAAHENYFSEANVVSAQTVTLQKTPLSSTNLVLTNSTLNGMSPGKTLCSARFKIVLDNVDPNSKLNLAMSNNGIFSYQESDFQFNQTQVFTNATLQSEWDLAVGKGILTQWPKPRIELRLDTSNNGVNNSAVYIPPDTNNGPHIELGNGDGVLLKNLQFDADAVAHETGHHLVYQTLKTTSGDSLVIHEGLADFLVMARTHNPCLGTMICPAGGTICMSTQCLRTANNKWTYTDPNLPTEAHKESQFISGMMWDISKYLGSTEAGARLLLKAVDFFPVAAGFPDLVQALMEADKVLNKGVHACSIQKVAYARGLQDLMVQSGIPNCTSYVSK